MDQSASYISKEKRKELQAELEALKGPKRKEILEALQYAKSLGDLSENAEYHQAREDQGKLEARIAQIESILQSSLTISGGGRGDTIEVGSKIVVRKSGEKENREYSIVGSEEADITSGKISNQSPLGRAFFGKKKGESVTISTPGGEVVYKIISVA